MQQGAPGTPGPGDRAGPGAPQQPPGDAATGAAGAAEPRTGKPESLLQTLKGLWLELPGLLSDRVDLLALELKRAGIALVQIVALVVAVSILGVTAWLVLWGAIVSGLVALGLPLALALLLALAVNLVAAWLAVARIRALLPTVQLPATRRHLTITPSPLHKPVAPDPFAHERTDFAAAGQPVPR